MVFTEMVFKFFVGRGRGEGLIMMGIMGGLGDMVGIRGERGIVGLELGEGF